MMRDILMALLGANLAAGLAVVTVLPFRALMRPRLGARCAYAMWIAPPLAALAVLIPHEVTAGGAIAPFVARAGGATAQILPAAIVQGNLWPAALVGVWAAGVLAMAGLLIRRQGAFVRSLGALSPAPDGDPRRVQAARTEAGPALVGALRPRIVTPADFETRYGADERDLILAHERTHLMNGDTIANAAACVVQCLGWFNPLIHLGVRLMRIDQEIACDADVIDRFPRSRRLYGELLLKTQLAAETLPLGCHWPARAAHPLKMRIAMLNAPQPERAERRAGLAVAGMLGLAAAAWAWAASAQAPSVIFKPDWLVKPTGADLVAAYPPDAVKAHIEGRATIGCGVAIDGRLTDCKVLSEGPDGAGFGAAALALSEHFQMKPMSKDGHPVAGGHVRIPIRFMLPSPPPPMPAT